MINIPTELITMLAGGVFSAVTALWSQSQKQRIERDQLLMQRDAALIESVRVAREYGAVNKKFEWTRRTIAIAAVFAVIILPKLAAIFCPDLPIFVGYTQLTGGFLFFTDPHDTTKWKALSGLVVTPLDTHLVAAIIGMYFGGSVVKNA